jgi:glycerate-2-kinase
MEYALAAADPYVAVDRLVHITDEQLAIGNLRLDLRNYERIFILGAGKASRGIALALEDKLGDRISDGVFVFKHGDDVSLRHARVVYAAHPIPDEGSSLGAQMIMDMADTMTEKDLVFAGITGGSSALLAAPVEGVSFEDIKKVHELLILSGADIFKINAVRKHLSSIKGGWLAEKILPATLINLTVSDVVGDQLDYITGPTVPDTSTFDDARCVMDEYGLWDICPSSVIEYMRRGGRAEETPKSFDGLPLHTFLIVAGDAACVAAEKRARELGFESTILTSLLRGEAKEAGSFFASIAHEISTFGRPISSPCALVAGGENVVTIGSDERGVGGPNQEFALSASLEIAGLANVVISAIDTDGFDGSTDHAGALIDGETRSTAIAQGFEPITALRKHDVGRMLHAIGDAVLTGPTGTNVNDLKILLVKE